jgi:plastocyanin
MRKLALVLTVSMIVAMTAVSLAPAAGAGGKSPVKLDGKVNKHGTKDVSKSTQSNLAVELDSYYISPTFTKVQAGEKLTITLKNASSVPHTFTSDPLNVDKEVDPGKTAKITVTVPDSAKAFQYYCRFHQGQGMQGAFYTATGSSSSNSNSSSSSGSGGYGY